MALVSAFLDGLKYNVNDTGDGEWGDTELLLYLNRAVNKLEIALSSRDSEWVLGDYASLLSEGYHSVSQPTRCIKVRDAYVSTVASSCTDLTFTNASSSIASAATNFATAGFAAGDRIYVSGSTYNDGVYRISSVTTVTIVVYGSLTNEGAGAGTATIVKESTDRIYKATPQELQMLRRSYTGAASPYKWCHRKTNIEFQQEADDDYGIIFSFDQHQADLVSTDNMPFNDDYDDPLRQAVIQMAKARTNEVDYNDLDLQRDMEAAAASKDLARRYAPKRYRIDF